jgi:hypothetical protein
MITRCHSRGLDSSLHHLIMLVLDPSTRVHHCMRAEGMVALTTSVPIYIEEPDSSECRGTSGGLFGTCIPASAIILGDVWIRPMAAGRTSELFVSLHGVVSTTAFLMLSANGRSRQGCASIICT